MNEKRFDALIVGAGLSGLLTAHSLSSLGLTIAIIDRGNFTNMNNIAQDFRTTAIAEGSKLYLEKIGFWKKISKFAQPINKIHVYDRNKTNKIEFQNPNKKSFLGYIVSNSEIKKKLIEFLSAKKNIKIMPNIELKGIETFNSFVSSATNNVEIKSKILIAADGKNSFVRKIVKTPIFKKQYNHKAVVINLNHNIDHNNIAYEIFFKGGPLAILPMKNKIKNKFSSSIVWSNDASFLSNMVKLEDERLKLLLNERVARYIGNIEMINNKKIFDLSAHLCTSFYENRIVYVGDAAHSIHPIAGQGWNLGIRDIENLIFSINEGKELGLDYGDKHICKKYHDLSYHDAFALYQVTDKLNYVFLKEGLIYNNIRHLGFYFIDNNRKIKNWISNFAMGKRKKFN